VQETSSAGELAGWRARHYVAHIRYKEYTYAQGTWQIGRAGTLQGRQQLVQYSMLPQSSEEIFAFVSTSVISSLQTPAIFWAAHMSCAATPMQPLM
jgi:hypothetical protein